MERILRLQNQLKQIQQQIIEKKKQTKMDSLKKSLLEEGVQLSKKNQLEEGVQPFKKSPLEEGVQPYKKSPLVEGVQPSKKSPVVEGVQPLELDVEGRSVYPPQLGRGVTDFEQFDCDEPGKNNG